MPEVLGAGADKAAWRRHLIAIAADRTRLGAEAARAALRWPREPFFQLALAIAADGEGLREEALEAARRAIDLDPGCRPAIRLARRLLVELGREREAFELWVQSVPAGRVFEVWPDALAGASDSNVCSMPNMRLRYEALRRAVARFEERSGDPERRAALARAMSGCGWLEEAAIEASRLERIDPVLERRVRVGRAVAKAIAWIDDEMSWGQALSLLQGAARSAGLGELEALEVRAGEAGSFVSPNDPLVRSLADAGLVVELVREVSGALVARLGVCLANGAVVAEGSRREVCFVLLEPFGVSLRARSRVLGRASRAGARFWLDLEALSPSPEVLERARAFRVGGEARSVRERLLARIAARALDSSQASVFGALRGARLRYVFWHELGHAVDLERLDGEGPFRIGRAARFIESGLSPEGTRARYEGAAELYALGYGTAPLAALASLAGAIERGPSAGLAWSAALWTLETLREAATTQGVFRDRDRNRAEGSATDQQALLALCDRLFELEREQPGTLAQLARICLPDTHEPPSAP